MKFKYKVGEKVRVLDGSDAPHYTAGWVDSMNPYVGKTLEVMRQESHLKSPVYKLVDGGGWSYDERYLAPAASVAPTTSDRIVVYIDKKDPSKVVAKDVSTGKTGVAKCSPEDIFDFYTGAKLAMNRLLGVEEKTEERQKTEIGDTVEFVSIQAGVFYPGYGGKGVVQDIDLDGDLWVLWEGEETSYCCGTEKVRLVSKKSSKRFTKTSALKSKFSVGQLVIGNAGANRYSITTEKTVWKVTAVRPNGFIEISGPKADIVGGFEVNADCFDLYTGTLPSFKAFCTESKYGWQKGRIYDIVNGKCIEDKRYNPSYCTSAEQMSDIFGVGFIRVME